jgi:hypothetical protein
LMMRLRECCRHLTYFDYSSHKNLTVALDGGGHLNLMMT